MNKLFLMSAVFLLTLFASCSNEMDVNMVDNTNNESEISTLANGHTFVINHICNGLPAKWILFWVNYKDAQNRPQTEYFPTIYNCSGGTYTYMWPGNFEIIDVGIGIHNSGWLQNGYFEGVEPPFVAYMEASYGYMRSTTTGNTTTMNMTTRFKNLPGY